MAVRVECPEEVEQAQRRHDLGGASVSQRNVQRFRGGLVFKAHRLCASLNTRLQSHNEEEEQSFLEGVPRQKDVLDKRFTITNMIQLGIELRWQKPVLERIVWDIYFFFTLVTGPRRSLSLKRSDTRVYEFQIRTGGRPRRAPRGGRAYLRLIDLCITQL